MERDKEEIKEFTLEVIKEDPYYEDGDLDNLIITINNEEKLTRDQKNQLEDVLGNSLKLKLEQAKNKSGSLLILEVDALSIYPDAYATYCMRG